MIVRSPTTVNTGPSWPVMRVVWKVISGYFSTLRKPSLLRSASLAGTPVSTLAVLITSSADDWSGSSATMIFPENSPNRPRTLLTIRCLATKPILVW